MHRIPILLSIVAVALLGLVAASWLPFGALAQEGAEKEPDGTPGAEDVLPQGVTFEAIGYGSAESLPATPVSVSVFRLRFEPGAGLSVGEGDPSLALVSVESGALTAVVEAPMTILRAAGEGTPFPEEAESVPAGEEFTLEEGDSALFPANVAGEVRHDGSDPTVVLVAEIAPAAGGGEDAGEHEGHAAIGTPVAGSTGAGAATNAPPVWPAPSDPLERTRLAGLEPTRRELLDYHVHAHLDIFVDGQEVVIPAAIGINIDDPGVRRFDTPDGVGYGGIELCEEPCISPLHTHDATGVLHTESAITQPNTLGQFFVEWGVRLDASCVGEYCAPETPIAVYVDGEEYARNPADIELTDRKQIAIVIGTPPSEIPASFDFTGV